MTTRISKPGCDSAHLALAAVISALAVCASGCSASWDAQSALWVVNTYPNGLSEHWFVQSTMPDLCDAYGQRLQDEAAALEARDDRVGDGQGLCEADRELYDDLVDVNAAFEGEGTTTLAVQIENAGAESLADATTPAAASYSVAGTAAGTWGGEITTVVESPSAAYAAWLQCDEPNITSEESKELADEARADAVDATWFATGTLTLKVEDDDTWSVSIGASLRDEDDATAGRLSQSFDAQRCEIESEDGL